MTVRKKVGMMVLMKAMKEVYWLVCMKAIRLVATKVEIKAALKVGLMGKIVVA
jgi:hypothetical protein